jgi:hypothetical protein
MSQQPWRRHPTNCMSVMSVSRSRMLTANLMHSGVRVSAAHGH